MSRFLPLFLLLGVLAPGKGFAQTGIAWREVPPPARRANAAMAYDSARHVTVLFGGMDGSGVDYGDTWEWDGSAWKLASTIGPSARSGAAMVYDPARKVMLLFGGAHDTKDTRDRYDDTWEWDGTGWKQVASTGPPARADAAMAFDTARGVAVLHGGQYYVTTTGSIVSTQAAYYGDTWEWDGTQWNQVATNGPSARERASMAYDAARGKTVLFGGYSPVTPNMRDTWEWDGSAWKSISTLNTPVPPGRNNASMAYDSTLGASVLLGGEANSAPLGDMWKWDGAAWTQVASTGTPVLEGAAMAYDSGRDLLVLLGGFAPTSANSPVSVEGDTLEWDGSAWQQRASPGPPPRGQAAMAYDSARDATVLFGGADQSGINTVVYGDTWERHGDTWTRLATTGPAARYRANMAYDSARGVTVLFGGYITGQGTLADTWEWDGAAWKQATTTGPPARDDASMAYDSARGRTVLYGGYSYGTPRLLGDTWEWDGSTWKEVATTGPAARYGAVMAFDRSRGKSVLFGGYITGQGTLADTWEWDGAAWKQAAATGPTSRMDASMFYDTTRNRIVLFGGIYLSGNNTRWGYNSETWEYDGSAWTWTTDAGPSPRFAASTVYDSAHSRAVLFGGTTMKAAYGDTWIASGPAYTMADAVHALEWAGGLSATPNGITAGPVGLANALRLLRKAAGLDPNP